MAPPFSFLGRGLFAGAQRNAQRQRDASQGSSTFAEGFQQLQQARAARNASRGAAVDRLRRLSSQPQQQQPILGSRGLAARSFSSPRFQRPLRSSAQTQADDPVVDEFGDDTVGRFIRSNTPEDVPFGVDRRTDPNFDFTQNGAGIISFGVKNDRQAFNILKNKLNRPAAREDIAEFLTEGTRFRGGPLSIQDLDRAQSFDDLNPQQRILAIRLLDQVGKDIERKTQKVNTSGLGLLAKIATTAAGFGVGGPVGLGLRAAGTGLINTKGRFRF